LPPWNLDVARTYFGGTVWSHEEKQIALAWLDRFQGSVIQAVPQALQELPRRSLRGIKNAMWTLRQQRGIEQYQEPTGPRVGADGRCDCGSILLMAHDSQAGVYHYCLMCGRDYYAN
jgi:hypothetical protein